ncbi:MAG: lytic transglycosylase domain-containing protein [Nitrospiraceae bacterium]|nr:lytic transglycosylase domain-containing protein [Nitrospiraceae bacterium]
MFALVLAAALLLFPAHRAGAVIYRYVGPDGVLHFSDTPVTGAVRVKSDYRPVDDHGGPAMKRRPAIPTRGASLNTGGLSSARMEKLIESKSEKYRMDPSLVRAVIRAESGFDCTAVSPKGAMGLMQLMPATAASLGVCNPFDPSENIDGGVRYLSHLLERFDGNLPLALAAYNAGPQFIEQYGAIPPYSETRNYIRRVLISYRGGSAGGLDGREPAGKYLKFVRNRWRRVKTRRPAVIYRINLPDGTVLYTNDPPGF